MGILVINQEIGLQIFDIFFFKGKVCNMFLVWFELWVFKVFGMWLI